MEKDLTEQEQKWFLILDLLNCGKICDQDGRPYTLIEKFNMSNEETGYDNDEDLQYLEGLSDKGFISLEDADCLGIGDLNITDAGNLLLKELRDKDKSFLVKMVKNIKNVDWKKVMKITLKEVDTYAPSVLGLIAALI